MTEEGQGVEGTGPLAFARKDVKDDEEHIAIVEAITIEEVAVVPKEVVTVTGTEDIKAMAWSFNVHSMCKRKGGTPWTCDV